MWRSARRVAKAGVLELAVLDRVGGVIAGFVSRVETINVRNRLPPHSIIMKLFQLGAQRFFDLVELRPSICAQSGADLARGL